MAATERLAELQDRIRLAERRQTEVREELIVLTQRMVDVHEVETALSNFDPVFESLCPSEQTRLVQLLIERIAYDGANAIISITFHPTGIKTLADKVAKGDAA